MLSLATLTQRLQHHAFGKLAVKFYRWYRHTLSWTFPKWKARQEGGVLDINEGTYRLGAGVIVSASHGGVVKIGKFVTLRRLITIHARQRIEIGDWSRIGEMVTIRDHNHFSEHPNAPGDKKGFQSAPIIIGSNVWVGVKVTVTPGVTIGDNAIIGANAVVTKDVPANCVAVGIPARVVRRLDAPTLETPTTE